MLNLKLNSKVSLYNTKVWTVAFLVALLTVLVYIPALQNYFVNWDDNLYVYGNPYIQSIDFESLKWMFTSFHASNWHPITWLSHSIDYAIGGLNPIGHHLTSIIFHGLNTFLVVILIVRLLNYMPEKISNRSSSNNWNYQSSLITGAVTGLLFGLHPIHVESVVWVSERKDVLFAFFFISSILSYLKYTSSKLQNPSKSHFNKGRNRLATRGIEGINYSLCLLFFILSLMSKPMAVTLPVVLIILDFYPLGRLDFKSAFASQRRVLVEKLPFLSLSVASSVITVIAQQSAIKPFETHHLGERFLIALRALSFYLLKMLWPTELSPLYPYPSKVSFLNIEYMGTFILVICITAFCIWSWKRQKVFSAIWAYYVMTLLPALKIIQVGGEATADRYTYLPSLGPFLLVGLGTLWVWNKFNIGKHMTTINITFFIISFIFTALLLSFLTIKQTKIWKDSLTLWNHALKLFPNDVPRAYYKRAEIYQKLGNYKQALDDFNKAIEINPYHATGYTGRGLLYANLGYYQQSIQDFDKAIRINPYDSELYYNRGLSYKLSGKYQQAIQDFNKAIQLNPRNIDAYLYRGFTYLYSGFYHQAIKDFQDAAQLGDIQAQSYLKSKGIGW